MDRDELARRVSEIPFWHHTLDLGQGVITPGWYAPREKLPKLHLPDLTGKTVLDIGAVEGFYSFWAERQGAARVLVTDPFCWGESELDLFPGFCLAREVYASHVQDLHIDVLDLSPDRIGVFDVVLFLGILYHMRHPLLALERVFSVTGGPLVLETHVDLVHHRRPAMAFYPGSELGNDPSNWCGPNLSCVEA